MKVVYIMHKKIHLRKKRKLVKVKKFLITIVMVIFSVFILINHINKKFTPVLLEIAELEVGKFSTIVINKAIAQVLEDKINADELFDSIVNGSGEIQSIDFNPIIVNQVLNVATSVVQNNLKLLEEGNLDTIGIYDMDLPEDRIEK